MVWFPDWPTKPIPNFTLSSSGLIALADLSTVAQRTAISGGSRWLDSLILAPGLHYQQAADDLVKGATSAIIDAVEDGGGDPVTLHIHNAATANYIQRIAKPGETVTLDVGALPAAKARYRLKRSDSGMHATVWSEDEMPDLGWLSHLLYLCSPVLTVVAIVFDVLLQDWWAISLLCALMLSRILNIWVIKQRSKPVKRPAPDPGLDPTKGPYDGMPRPDKTATFNIKIGDGKSAVRLRGTPEDLRAITEDTWLRTKSTVEGWLEAFAKLLVYLVAAMSGNMTQVGQIIQASLLLLTAGLLALSNAEAKSFRMNGRVAAPTTPPYPNDSKAGNIGGSGRGGCRDGEKSNGSLVQMPVPQPLPPYYDPSAGYSPGGGPLGRGRGRNEAQPGGDRWMDDDKEDQMVKSWQSSTTTTSDETVSADVDEVYYYEYHRHGHGHRRPQQGSGEQHRPGGRIQRMGAGQQSQQLQAQRGRRGNSRGREGGRYEPPMDDWAERGEIRHIRDSYPFDDSVEYS